MGIKGAFMAMPLPKPGLCESLNHAKTPYTADEINRSITEARDKYMVDKNTTVTLPHFNAHPIFTDTIAGVAAKELGRFSVTAVENGYVLDYTHQGKTRTYIAADIDELKDRFVAALVEQRLK